MVDRERIAAVITTYNGATRGYMLEAIASVLSQTMQPSEILVVDDGSTDGTAEYLRERFGGAVRVESLSKNAGPSAARNHGIRVAACPLVAFLDDDDVWLPKRLEEQIAVMKEAGARMVFGRAELIDSRGTVLPDRWPTYPEALSWPGILFRNPVQGPSGVLVRREALLAAGGFPEAFRIAEDWVLWARIARLTPIRFLDKVVSRYRQHDQQAAAGRSTTWIREQTLAALRELVRELPPAQAALVLSSYVAGGALRALANRKPREALRLARAATGRVDWPSLIRRAAVATLGGVSPRFFAAANRMELRRLVERFRELGIA